MKEKSPIPLWLKHKSADFPAEKDKYSGKLMPAIIVGTLVSYFGLMAMEKAKPNNIMRAQEPTQFVSDREPVIVNSQAEKKSVPARRLTATDLAAMEPQLMEIHRQISEEKKVGSCDGVAKQKYSRQRMTLPSRYGETLCYAETSHELSGRLNDRQYLELAAYYFRRCLYLIDGQLQGQFKKPKGGDDEIRERQKAVYIALDTIEQSERL